AISLSTGIAEAMVQNMLNLDPEEITEPVMADCVRESINMICGNFVRKLDSERVFDLSIPQYERISGNIQQEQDLKDQALCLTFTADGGHIEVTLTAPDLLPLV
ncbi:MAG: chemotaxis protein CheX, partial [Deltaproteobacteria bacterium]|nr:chemotaxis protein CheX [Deltaproteobacteria bacterium]